MKAEKGSWIVVALSLVIVGSVLYLMGQDEEQVNEFEEEPQVVIEGRSVPVEEYVAGVVAGEMKKEWPVEAYAAQAILARSFVIERMTRTGSNEISTEFEEAQAYKPQQITEAIRRAVEMTRGEVMTHAGRFVRAWFHSYSGGRTATAKEGLNFAGEEPPYIVSVKLPPNRFAPEDVTSWKTEYSLPEVASLLADQGISSPITDIRISDRGNSGRITGVTIVHADGQTRMHGSDFRLALDPMRMKSTLVEDMEIVDDKLHISGTGFGHGVGLSQWDAFMFAKMGRRPEEIVEEFFRNIEVRKLWD